MPEGTPGRMLQIGNDVRVATVKPVIDTSVRGICARPYPNHPRGCPNWNKKDGCPPQALLLEKALDLAFPVIAVCTRFDFGEHVARMRNRHPNWSQRQLECCLYWQGKARKRLKELVKETLQENAGSVALMCPEACGVNITETLKQIGIELEWPPVNYTWQVAFVGRPRVEQ